MIRITVHSKGITDEMKNNCNKNIKKTIEEIKKQLLTNSPQYHNTNNHFKIHSEGDIK